MEKIVQLMDENTDRHFGLIIEPFARAIEAEVRAQLRLAGPAKGGHGEQE